MAVLVEGNNLGDLLKYEAPIFYSREAVTILAGSGSDRELVIGQVLGCRTKSSASAAKIYGDGNGTISSVTLGAQAETGIYKLVCTAAGTNSGTFSVTSPAGIPFPALTVGTAYVSDHINLTVGDGATDWGVGAVIHVTVSGDNKYVQLNPDAVDGTQDAVGIIIQNVTAADGSDAQGVAIVRDAILNEDLITWTSGMTTPQKATALVQLKKLGILTRKGA
jgi:hypothetical protein